MVPDVPEEVEMKMKREHYMAKEALAENQVQVNSEKYCMYLCFMLARFIFVQLKVFIRNVLNS